MAGLLTRFIPQPTVEQQAWALKDIPKTFVARVLDPQKVLFVGKVVAIESFNEDGPFTILAGHTNFISIISKSLDIYTGPLAKQTIALERGVVRFANNDADIYLGLAAEVSKNISPLNS